MGRTGLEVADIFRIRGPAYREGHGHAMSSAQRQVMRAIEICRTAVLGGHVDKCDRCGHRRISYNSCANRHCNKCQSLARAKWLAKHNTQLLPVSYFHLVFTVPDQITAVALQNKKVVYGDEGEPSRRTSAGAVLRTVRKCARVSRFARKRTLRILSGEQ